MYARALQSMAHPTRCLRLVRYLVVQGCLSVAVGAAFGGLMYAGDIAGIGSLVAAAQPMDAIIFLAGSVMTLCPCVLATAIGLLAFDRSA